MCLTSNPTGPRPRLTCVTSIFGIWYFPRPARSNDNVQTPRDSNTKTYTNTKYTCDTGQTRNKLLKSARGVAEGSGRAVVVCGLRARMMYSTLFNANAKANCGCGAMLGRDESLGLEVVEGSGVRFGPPGFEEDFLPEWMARELAVSRKARTLEARGAVAVQAVQFRLRLDGSHALRCLFVASSALLCALLDAPTALAACCGFDLCYKNILYLVFGIFRCASYVFAVSPRCG